MNDCGTAIDSIHVQSINCHCKVFIPNVFSPNQDNINDNFMPIIPCELDEYEFKIFNRWGEQVFQSTMLNDGWNGYYKGEETSSGVYFYLLKYKFSDGERKIMTGDVTLIR